MHGGFMHIFFNMYALFIFGPILENVWGPKRFFIFYMVCGLGAALTHESVIFFQYHHLIQSLTPENLQVVLNEGTAYFHQGKVFTDPDMQSLQILLNTPTVGASGAIFGFCLHSVFFPEYSVNTSYSSDANKSQIPGSGIRRPRISSCDNTTGKQYCTCCSPGGMLFGYILIRYWRKTTNTLY